MEALAISAIPPILKFTWSTLTTAWEQYSNVQAYQEQCKLLIQRCQDLFLVVCRHAGQGGLTSEMVDNIRILEATCISVKETITTLSGKSFAWRLLHQDKLKQAISSAESAVMDAFTVFNFGAHMNAQRLHSEMDTARQTDHEKLVAHLESLAGNDQKILAALQTDSRGRRRLEELVVALTKHVRSLTEGSTGAGEPIERFLCKASASLQRISKKPAPEISHWTVTSLEVTFDSEDEENCIGRGGFGNIYKGEWNGQIVAVKEMYAEDARLLDRDNLKSIIQEIRIWSRIAHPHVLPFYGACLEATRPFIVTRFCPNGNALEYLRVHPDADRVCMLHEVSLGMTYLHTQSIIHADLKGSNILIGDDGKALITDFGLSHLQDQVSSNVSRTRASAQRLNGTLRWMAPELLDGEKLEKPADVYSFALLAWELYTGLVPFGHIPERALTRRIVDKQERLERPQSMDDSIWGLVQRCWAHDSARRPVFSVIQSQLKSFILKDQFLSPSSSVALSVPSRPSTSRNSATTEISVEPVSKMFDAIQLSNSITTATESAPEPPPPPLPLLPQIHGLTEPVRHVHVDPLEGRDSADLISAALDADWLAVGLTTGDILIFSAKTAKFCRKLVGHKQGVWDLKLVCQGGVWRGSVSERLSAIHMAAKSVPGIVLRALGVVPSVIPQNSDDYGWDRFQGSKTSIDSGAAEGWGQPNALLVSGGMDRTLRVWDVESGICLHELNGHSATIRCILVLHNRPIAVTGSRDHYVAVWNIQSGVRLRKLKGHTDSIRCLDVCGNIAVSGSYDNTCRVWNVDTGDCLHVLSGHTNRVYSVAHNGTWIASGGADGTVRLWRASDGYCDAVIQAHVGIAGNVRLTPEHCVSASSKGEVAVYSLVDKTMHSFQAHESSIVSLQVDLPFVITGGTDGAVKLFVLATGICVRHLGEPCEPTGSSWKFVRGSKAWAISTITKGRAAVEIWTAE